MDQYLEFMGNHPLLVGLLVAVTAAIVYTEFARLTRKYGVLGPSDAVQVMNREPTLVLDVRSDAEARKGGRINGARQIPLNRLKDRLSEIEKHKDKHVIVYCENGSRSAQACNTLTKQGFEKVSNLQGGINAWQAANLPLSKK
ncbi:MAG: rhodanese-like domain-containing protein [Ectothiorhodospira sp.]